MARNGVLEVEVNGEHNESLQFFPLARKLRGRLEFARVGSRMAMTLVPAWGKAVPGQVIGYDAARKVGYVREPLREERHQELRERLAAKFECGFSPAVEEFPLPDGDRRATWLYWMGRAVEAGLATLVCGTMPDELPGAPTKRLFKTEPDPSERLLEGILEMMQKQGQLLEALAGKVKV